MRLLMTVTLIGVASIVNSSCTYAKSDCVDSLIQTKSTWEVEEFRSPENPRRGFSPITELNFKNKKMYVTTLGGEPSLTDYQIRNGVIVFRPIYLSPLTIGGGIGEAAVWVQPYASNNVVHQIERCVMPNEIEISIKEIQSGRRDVDLGTVVLKRKRR